MSFRGACDRPDRSPALRRHDRPVFCPDNLVPGPSGRGLALRLYHQPRERRPPIRAREGHGICRSINPLEQGFPRRACRARRQANACGGFLHDQIIEAVCATGIQYLDPVGIGLETQALWPGQSPHPRVVRSPVRPVAPAGRSPAARAGAGARSEIPAPLTGVFTEGSHIPSRGYRWGSRTTVRNTSGSWPFCRLASDGVAHARREHDLLVRPQGGASSPRRRPRSRPRRAARSHQRHGRSPPTLGGSNLLFCYLQPCKAGEQIGRL